MELHDVVQCLKSSVISSKEKLSLRQLNSDFKLLMGEWIPFQKLGFKRLEDLIRSIPELNLVLIGNDHFVTAKASERSAHMTEMISRQKPAKRKPPRFRFSRGPPPPRMQEMSHWRPNFKPVPYRGSRRPQAVRHSQFVNSSPVVNHVPSVASKVVIPEHSSYNANRTQQAPPAQSVRRPDINLRLTTSRIQENIKALLRSNSIQDAQKYSLTHNGAAPPSNKTSYTETKPSSAQTSNINNSTDLHVSARKRITKKMSELNLERDSGNSSPTNDILPPSPSITPELSLSKTPEFIRTKDPLADLKTFAEIHKLGEVTVDIAQVKQKRLKFFSCKIKVGQKYTYTSYPNEFPKPVEAQTFCCEEALKDLIPKCKRKSLMISNEKDILDRIPPMLEKHNNGIWAWQLQMDYSDKYNELLPNDWLQIIDSSPCVQIEKIAEDHILYHCQPGDKEHQRGAGAVVIPSSVSIPAYTVQFGADGKFSAQVTNAVSANEIWCEQVDTEEHDAFVNMWGRMQVYYQEHEDQLKPTTFVPAGYYIAKYDEEYHRVRAVKVGEEEVDCFFIDLGDEETIPKTDIFVLQRVYATAQAQAFVCRLVGLEDMYDVSDNSKSLASLYGRNLVLELAVDLMDNENAKDVWPVFMCDAETGHSINEALISALKIELATPILNPDEIITEVYVSNIENNGDVYVQVRTQGYYNLEQLKREIEEQITAKPPTELLYKVTKSNSREKLYFMKHGVPGTWYRTKIIDWSPDANLAQVYFVDEGHTDVIAPAEQTLYPLETLNEEFNNYPYQAVRVRMAMHTTPSNLDTIPPNFVELASKAMPKDVPVLLKIIGTTAEEDIPLAKLFRRSTDGLLFCINESIALQSELNTKKEDSLKTRFKLNQGASSDNVPSTGSLRCPPIPELGVDTYFQVSVPVAVSPYNFFVQPSDSGPELNDLMERLQERYSHVQYGNLKVEDVRPGDIYASKHEDDGYWYRTSVIKVISSGSSVSVFYCDFGYYQTLPVKHLVPLDKEFMELPYQALKAKLAAIKPKQSKWTMEDCEQFKELIEKKMLMAKLKNIEKDILYESDLVLKLELVDTSGENDVFIGPELVERGIAVEEED